MHGYCWDAYYTHLGREGLEQSQPQMRGEGLIGRFIVATDFADGDGHVANHVWQEHSRLQAAQPSRRVWCDVEASQLGLGQAVVAHHRAETDAAPWMGTEIVGEAGLSGWLCYRAGLDRKERPPRLKG
jgi:hypothetical protein